MNNKEYDHIIFALFTLIANVEWHERHYVYIKTNKSIFAINFSYLENIFVSTILDLNSKFR